MDSVAPGSCQIEALVHGVWVELVSGDYQWKTRRVQKELEKQFVFNDGVVLDDREEFLSGH